MKKLMYIGAMALASSLFVLSCTKRDVLPPDSKPVDNAKSLGDTKKSFSYSTYDEFTEKNIDLTLKSAGNIDDINKGVFDKFKVDVSAKGIDKTLEEQSYSSKNNGNNGRNQLNFDKHLTKLDRELLEKFNIDNQNVGFETALLNFEDNVQSENLGTKEFQKYNRFANVVRVVNDNDNGVFAAASPCSEAIAANVLATVGLAACGTGILCFAAVAAKVLAVKAVIDNCGNDD